ncbi:NUDIX hydrolase [Marinoscillum sp.]|uniref:NUDIX hydrolase n=1 Tax=Marinoscillum sp. TaxID=2024838 RepID=UPI003BAD362B
MRPTTSMDMNKQVLEYLKRVQSLAKTGLTYAEDPYDRERYEELKESTNNLLGELVGVEVGKIISQFENLDDYPTPKVDVRGVIIKEGKILLIREKTDGKWAMPGGWADNGYSPSENIVKEVWEESGLRVRPERLLAVWDKRKHDHPADVHSVYKLNFLCVEEGGTLNPGHETMGAQYFGIDELPELSLMRNTAAQIQQLYELAISGGVDFD